MLLVAIYHNTVVGKLQFWWNGGTKKILTNCKNSLQIAKYPYTGQNGQTSIAGGGGITVQKKKRQIAFLPDKLQFFLTWAKRSKYRYVVQVESWYKKKT
jgi:hypothetical protein